MRGSVAETIFSTMIGFAINYAANIVLMPHLWNTDNLHRSAFQIGVIFTVISVVRGFGVRRLFNHPRVATVIDRADRYYGAAAEWLKTRLASGTSRVPSAGQPTTSPATTTDTPIASPLGAATVNLPEEKPLRVRAGDPDEPRASQPWNCS